MSRFVLDASIILTWCFPDEESQKAEEISERIAAGDLAVAVLFFAEATLLALIAGTVGFAGGVLLARQVGRSIFDSQITIQPVLLPVILTIAVIVTFGGSAAAIRRAVRFDPVFALRGEI